MNRCWESFGERRLVVVELGADRTAVPVDRVVPAPNDPRVGGEPVIVKLVAHVADALACGPSELVVHPLIERLGDQHVVVHGRDVAPERAQEWGVRAGREQGPARVEHAAVGYHRHAGVGLAQITDRAVLVDPHAGEGGRRAQPVRELARVDERRPGSRAQ